jgi:hypothetical protein
MGGVIAFVLMNVCGCIVISLRRDTSRRIDIASVVLSSGVATAVLHVIALILDIRSSKWLMVSIPIAFGVGLFVSGLTSACVQAWKRRHALRNPSHTHPR